MKSATGGSKKLGTLSIHGEPIDVITPTKVKEGKFVQKDTSNFGSISANIRDEELGKLVREAFEQCELQPRFTAFLS